MSGTRSRRPFAATTLLAAAVIAACAEPTRPEPPALDRAAAAPRFTIVDLGAVGGPESIASAINDAGVVAGTTGDPLLNSGPAFTWRPQDGLTLIGDLGGGTGYAFGLNNAGEVAGQSLQPVTLEYRATYWPRGGAPIDLGSLGGSLSVAADINDAHLIVGSSDLIPGNPFVWHAFRTRLGEPLEDLGALPGATQSAATAVNARGDIVGYGDEGTGVWHVLLWPAAGGLVDLGTLPGSLYSVGWAINRHGVIAGWAQSSTGPEFRAFVLESGIYTDLGALPGEPGALALGINDRGEVVGESGPAGLGANAGRAFHWSGSTGMTDLGTLGGCCSLASAINNRGDVVGWAKNAAGQFHAVLWQRTP